MIVDKKQVATVKKAISKFDQPIRRKMCE